MTKSRIDAIRNHALYVEPERDVQELLVECLDEIELLQERCLAYEEDITDLQIEIDNLEEQVY